MGIDGLNPFLKKECSQAWSNVPLRHLTGQRLGIDANNILYTHWAVAQKRVIFGAPLPHLLNETSLIPETRKLWLEAITRLNETLVTSKVLPVWVFDGPHPKEKMKTQQDRQRQKQETLDKIAALKSELNGAHPLMVTSAKIQDLRNLMARVVRVPDTEIQECRQQLQEWGIPCLTAPGEAEKMCSMLCRDRRFSLILSADTDCLAYLCPKVATELVSTPEGPGLAVISLHQILNGLQLNEKQFVDLCILLGTDYGSRIPNIGPGRAYKYIKNGYTVDQLSPETLGTVYGPKQKSTTMALEIADVNIDFCRSEFQYQSSDITTDQINPTLTGKGPPAIQIGLNQLTNPVETVILKIR